MSRSVAIEAMCRHAFSEYGDVIDASGEPTMMINDGRCARFHDRASLSFAEHGRAGISVFHGQPYALPLELKLVERHPLGSQAFLPMSGKPFLVIVAADIRGIPAEPRAFLTEAQQGVNIHRGVWHGVLTPLGEASSFAVVDWIGSTVNLEEHRFDSPWQVHA